MASKPGAAEPNPNLVYETLNAYQNTAALKAAIELDLFTKIGQGFDTVAALAERCQATARGVRILCDYLTILGFLSKTGQRYALTLDSATFLDRRSPAYQGSSSGFLALPETVNAFMHLGETIHTGRPPMGAGEGSVSHENPIWVDFARSMAPLTIPVAEEIARAFDADRGRKWKVLDIAAGHGLFAITIAKHNPNAEIFAQDWPNVLDVAEENARAYGVAGRFHRLPGSAFEVDFGSGYDIVLVTNFLHHFDPPTNEGLLRKIAQSIAPGGTVVTMDLVPNPDRISPARAASFSMMMLGMTPAGDAYTFAEYEQMFRNAGFRSNVLHAMTLRGHSLIFSRLSDE
jgi:2-polyprenyl-3-methyl-5-hydroxy-6-metoxy-1,4-benzoquinol methylase